MDMSQLSWPAEKHPDLVFIAVGFLGILEELMDDLLERGDLSGNEAQQFLARGRARFEEAAAISLSAEAVATLAIRLISEMEGRLLNPPQD